MSLSYTTGNPNNLTGGATASMNDIQGPFTDIKTFLTDSSGAVNDTILTSPTNGVWRGIFTCVFILNGLTTTKSYSSSNGINVSGGAGAATLQGLWAPPAGVDVAVSSKTARLRLRVPYAINGTAPGINITWGIYPITSSAGGASTISLTLGTVITGSTVTATAPTVDDVVTGSSFDLSAVTGTNMYVIGAIGSGSQAAASVVIAQPIIEMRHT